MVVSTSTRSPSTLYGLYCHCFTASIADVTSRHQCSTAFRFEAKLTIKKGKGGKNRLEARVGIEPVPLTDLT
jgi:hypothetical protein